ncbi:MAG TPA: VIT1/CCC1 transporter family protein [Burkholderiales bacterium]|jgi:VIT1/CCC1 family predicted Fe2+/Mn2+ transporter|nr:VIT1/CCC1 transporter family protein [Burkholderiales bacterium]
MHALDSWIEEKRSAYLYRVVAECERGTAREALFRELAAEADKQAQIWAGEIRRQGGAVPQDYEPDLRTRIVARLTRSLGPRATRGVLAAMKVRGMSLYATVDPRHYVPGAASGAEGRHRGLAGGGNLRAAVFGVNDGLVSNASLILGVAGATSHNEVILLSGVAGLLAGAFSMAAGEYVSVRSQREMFEYQIGLEAEELKQYPKEEAGELALIYEARGVPRAHAQRMADDIVADPGKALDALAREELGLNPDALGSPWGAAGFSFASFAAGALIPLLPFLFSAGGGALAVSIALTAAALFAVGSALSLFTGRQAFAGGLRMLAIGGAAGALTFLIGKWLGVTLG